MSEWLKEQAWKATGEARAPESRGQPHALLCPAGAGDHFFEAVIREDLDLGRARAFSPRRITHRTSTGRSINGSSGKIGQGPTATLAFTATPAT
jgi:hypothetical protein